MNNKDTYCKQNKEKLWEYTQNGNHQWMVK